MIRECPFANNPQLVGDPVDTYSGAVVERQRDFRLAGPLPLEWFRVYNSQQSDKIFALGRGQSHEFACTLRFELDGIRWQGPLGQSVHFPPLLKDGQSEIGGGKRLTRISRLVYHLHEHKQPVCEFVFADPLQAATLKRMFRGSQQILFGYDKQQLASITDALDNEIFVEFNNQGLLAGAYIPKTRFRDRRTLIRYDYDQRSNIEVATDLYGNSLKFSYDAANRMRSRTDRNGHTFVYAYDSRGRCVHTVGEDGVLDNRLDYEIDKVCTKVTQSNGAVWRYHYELGKLVSIEDPLGGVRKYVYDDKGRLEQELDCNDNATHAVYNEEGALVGKLDPLGHFKTEPININETQPNNHTVARNAAEFEYGYVVKIELNVHSNTPEPSSIQESQQADALNENDVRSSDKNFGFVVGRNWWPEPTIGRRFDLTGNLFQQVNRHGNTRRWVYDPNGNISKFVDFDGGIWKYGYRSWNHLVEEVNPVGGTNRLEYDSQENLIRFTDGGGTESQYTYDLNNNLIGVGRHGSVRETYQLDSAGNLIAKFAADGRMLLSLEYGPANLLSKRVLSSGGVHSFQYNSKGRYLAADTEADSVIFQYDGYGNRCLEKRNGRGVESVFQGSVQYKESIWLEKFRCVYQRNRSGELSVTDPTGRTHRVVTSRGRSVQRILSNGTSEVAKYDELGRCESKEVKRSGRRYWKRTYQWSGEGDLREIDDNQSGKTCFSYDASHRLVSRKNTNGAVDEFAFDVANNLKKLAGTGEYVLQSGNRLLSANDESFQYNDRNHVSSRLGKNAIKYTYDSQDQLVQASLPNGEWRSEYDALGRRVRRTLGGKTTEYLWNTDQLAAEISFDGRLRLYIYYDALALTPFMFIDYQSIDAEPTSGKCYFIFSDQIASPVRVEDELGRIVWQATYEPFGEATLSAENQIELNLRFPGHYWDADLKLNYNRFRYYDPLLGRYIQSDPIGLLGGTNLYAYATSPLGVVDVRGLTCSCGNNHPPGEECPNGKEKQPLLLPPGPPPPPPPTAAELAAAIPGHGHDRHGSQVTDAQQVASVQTGMRPDGVQTKKPGLATTFSSPQVEVDAVNSATQIATANDNAGLVDRSIKVGPNGVAVLPRQPITVAGPPEGTGSGIQVQRDANGAPLPNRPTEAAPPQQNATVVLERQPSTGEWVPVTQFPTNEPPTQ